MRGLLGFVGVAALVALVFLQVMDRFEIRQKAIQQAPLYQQSQVPVLVPTRSPTLLGRCGLGEINSTSTIRSDARSISC